MKVYRASTLYNDGFMSKKIEEYPKAPIPPYVLIVDRLTSLSAPDGAVLDLRGGIIEHTPEIPIGPCIIYLANDDYYACGNEYLCL